MPQPSGLLKTAQCHGPVHSPHTWSYTLPTATTSTEKEMNTILPWSPLPAILQQPPSSPGPLGSLDLWARIKTPIICNLFPKCSTSTSFLFPEDFLGRTRAGRGCSVSSTPGTPGRLEERSSLPQVLQANCPPPSPKTPHFLAARSFWLSHPTPS